MIRFLRGNGLSLFYRGPKVPLQPPSRGFTLIEVVLAMGIVSFALVGILGLFPVAMATARDSQNETRVASFTQQIISDLKSRRGLQLSSGGAFNTTVFTNPGGVTLYYDRDGSLVNAGNATIYFTVLVKLTPGTPASLIPNGYDFTIRFTWPGNTGVSFGGVII